MDLTPDDTPVAYTINRYVSGEVFIDGTGYTKPLILTRDGFRALVISQAQDLTSDHIQSWQQDDPFDLLVIGTGQSHELLPDLAAYCFARRLGFECMTSQSAARIHSILMAEHRAFLMVLFP